MKAELVRYVIVWCLCAAIAINISITGIIQRIQRPDLTETQLFILIPENFIWNFK